MKKNQERGLIILIEGLIIILLGIWIESMDPPTGWTYNVFFAILFMTIGSSSMIIGLMYFVLPTLRKKKNKI
ncbi:MAG: hypothetical protein ACFE75_10250 [Candidatus Hodarchaeota archaeon]